MGLVSKSNQTEPIKRVADRDENIALKAQLTKEREIGRLEGELEALKRQMGQG